uniref:Ig-like domain-containing protein n=1 Tax=Macrostomum lignano TaxID=282301 RepID=A0A1I8IHV8_9PLAT
PGGAAVAIVEWVNVHQLPVRQGGHLHRVQLGGVLRVQPVEEVRHQAGHKVHIAQNSAVDLQQVAEQQGSRLSQQAAIEKHESGVEAQDFVVLKQALAANCDAGLQDGAGLRQVQRVALDGVAVVHVAEVVLLLQPAEARVRLRDVVVLVHLLVDAVEPGLVDLLNQGQSSLAGGLGLGTAEGSHGLGIVRVELPGVLKQPLGLGQVASPEKLPGQPESAVGLADQGDRTRPKKLLISASVIVSFMTATACTVPFSIRESPCRNPKRMQRHVGISVVVRGGATWIARLSLTSHVSPCCTLANSTFSSHILDDTPSSLAPSLLHSTFSDIHCCVWPHTKLLLLASASSLITQAALSFEPTPSMSFLLKVRNLAALSLANAAQRRDCELSAAASPSMRWHTAVYWKSEHWQVSESNWATSWPVESFVDMASRTQSEMPNGVSATRTAWASGRHCGSPRFCHWTTELSQMISSTQQSRIRAQPAMSKHTLSLVQAVPVGPEVSGQPVHSCMSQLETDADELVTEASSIQLTRISCGRNGVSVAMETMSDPRSSSDVWSLVDAQPKKPRRLPSPPSRHGDGAPWARIRRPPLPPAGGLCGPAATAAAAGWVGDEAVEADRHKVTKTQKLKDTLTLPDLNSNRQRLFLSLQSVSGERDAPSNNVDLFVAAAVSPPDWMKKLSAKAAESTLAVSVLLAFTSCCFSAICSSSSLPGSGPATQQGGMSAETAWSCSRQSLPLLLLLSLAASSCLGASLSPAGSGAASEPADVLEGDWIKFDCPYDQGLDKSKLHELGASVQDCQQPLELLQDPGLFTRALVAAVLGKVSALSDSMNSGVLKGRQPPALQVNSQHPLVRDGLVEVDEARSSVGLIRLRVRAVTNRTGGLCAVCGQTVSSFSYSMVKKTALGIRKPPVASLSFVSQRSPAAALYSETRDAAGARRLELQSGALPGWLRCDGAAEQLTAVRLFKDDKLLNETPDSRLQQSLGPDFSEQLIGSYRCEAVSSQPFLMEKGKNIGFDSLYLLGPSPFPTPTVAVKPRFELSELVRYTPVGQQEDVQKQAVLFQKKKKFSRPRCRGSLRICLSAAPVLENLPFYVSSWSHADIKPT